MTKSVPVFIRTIRGEFVEKQNGRRIGGLRT